MTTGNPSRNLPPPFVPGVSTDYPIMFESAWIRGELSQIDRGSIDL